MQLRVKRVRVGAPKWEAPTPLRFLRQLIGFLLDFYQGIMFAVFSVRG